MKKKKGSMTLYLCLILVLISSLLLSLVELARMQGLRTLADKNAVISDESAFTAYQPILWNEFDLLFYAAGNGTNKVSTKSIEKDMFEIAKANGKLERYKQTTTGLNLYQMNVRKAEVKRYELATDQDGRAFEEQVASFMLQTLAKDTVNQLIHQYTQVGEAGKKDTDLNGRIEAAQEKLDEIKAKQDIEAKKASQGLEKAAQKDSGSLNPQIENPMDIINRIRQQGIFSQILKNPSVVSDKKIQLTDPILERTCEKGNIVNKKSMGLYEKVLLQKYLERHFSSFGDPAKERPLSYELEYIIAGKDSDRENLESVAYRLLAVREAANFAYLITDEEKKVLAMTLAGAIAGILLSPELAKVIQYGVLAAWAYAESIQDLQILYGGGKVPVLKDASRWQTDLMDLEKTNETAKKQSGLSYKEYLQAFLYLESVKELSCRCMDLMEQIIHMERGCESLRMDQMIQSVETQYFFEAAPVFLSVFPVLGRSESNYIFQVTDSFSYARIN